MTLFKSILGAAAVAITSSGANAQSLSLEGGGAASLTGIVPQTYAQFTAQDGIDLQVVLGQTLTRAALKLAAGKIDMAVVPPGAYRAMSVGKGPYAKNADQAKELAPNIRALFAFPAGTFHPVVWADSGIENWGDLSGKRVYIGPPAGAASAQIQSLIELGSGGLKAGEDYEGVRAPWGAAQQAFQDGQFDVYVGSIAVGSQALNELSLQRKIRVLGIPDAVRASEGWAKFLLNAAQFESTIKAGTYVGQINGDKDQTSTASAMMMSVHADMDEDTAYALTKAYWENLNAMMNANALMKSINPEAPFAGMNAKLHSGALRYYGEVGINVPKSLMP